jgi:hypothetical protein
MHVLVKSDKTSMNLALMCQFTTQISADHFDNGMAFRENRLDASSPAMAKPLVAPHTQVVPSRVLSAPGSRRSPPPYLRVRVAIGVVIMLSVRTVLAQRLGALFARDNQIVFNRQNLIKQRMAEV